MELTDPVVTAGLERLEDDPASRDTAAECHSLLVEGGGVYGYSQFVVQGFLWYLLPRRWPAHQWNHVVSSLARLLEACGFARYAAICRSAQTASVLRAYARDPKRGWERARELEMLSGVAPPNLNGCTWSAGSGTVEAEAALAVAAALEMAVTAGELRPGAPGWLERQREIADALLRRESPDLEGRSYLDAIVVERVERWTRAGTEDRRSVLEPLIPHLVDVQPPPEDLSGLEPLRWLLLRGERGIPVHLRGDLRREGASEFGERFGLRTDGGWGEPTGPLMAILEGLDLLRRKGLNLRTTPEGRSLAADPPTLWRLLGKTLWQAPRTCNDVAELALALLLRGGPERESRLGDRIHPMVAAGGQGPPHETHRAVFRFAWLAEPLGLLEVEGTGTPSQDRGFALTELGRATTLEVLSARAIRRTA